MPLISFVIANQNSTASAYARQTSPRPAHGAACSWIPQDAFGIARPAARPRRGNNSR